jgi:hypothetical protein
MPPSPPLRFSAFGEWTNLRGLPKEFTTLVPDASARERRQRYRELKLFFFVDLKESLYPCVFYGGTSSLVIHSDYLCFHPKTFFNNTISLQLAFVN